MSYSFEKKKKLLERINNLTLKDEFMEIKKIILKHNPNKDYMENSNGIFMQFNNLVVETYLEINDFLNQLEHIKIGEEKNKLIESSEMFSEEMTNSENVMSDTMITNNGKISINGSRSSKLTNTETHILNRKKYENELMKNAGDEELKLFTFDSVKKKSSKKTNENDIFVKEFD